MNLSYLSSRCPSILSVTCQASDSWHQEKTPDFFRERKWISPWPKWPLTGMGALAGSSSKKHNLQKWSNSFLYWRSPLGSLQLTALHVLEETNVMRKAASMECVQPSRMLQGSLGWVYSRQLPFPSSLSPLPCLPSQMTFVFFLNSFKNRTWKKIFGVFWGKSSSTAVLESSQRAPLQSSAASEHDHNLGSLLCMINNSYCLQWGP